MSSPTTPLFVCHANCSRSLLASRLYQLVYPDAPCLSAGLEAGQRAAERALAMLECWGADATQRQPRQLDRGMCDKASAVFVMAAPYVRRLLLEYGPDLATKTYLFADPFTRPTSFGHGAYTVSDPSFDARPARVLVEEYAWVVGRVLQLRRALRREGPPLIAAADYLDLLESVDPRGH
jgi:protein-tyrosine-phosphatase